MVSISISKQARDDCKNSESHGEICVDCERCETGMTTAEAREYFAACGLTYDDVTEGDILVLVMILNRNIKQAAKNGEMSTESMYLSKKTDIKKLSNGKITRCFLFINSHYFTQRECISFNRDGFIGFCGWADSKNTKPIVASFIEWCDYMKEAAA